MTPFNKKHCNTCFLIFSFLLDAKHKVRFYQKVYRDSFTYCFMSCRTGHMPKIESLTPRRTQRATSFKSCIPIQHHSIIMTIRSCHTHISSFGKRVVHRIVITHVHVHVRTYTFTYTRIYVRIILYMSRSYTYSYRYAVDIYRFADRVTRFLSPKLFQAIN